MKMIKAFINVTKDKSKILSTGQPCIHQFHKECNSLCNFFEVEPLPKGSKIVLRCVGTPVVILTEHE